MLPYVVVLFLQKLSTWQLLKHARKLSGFKG